MKTRKYSTKTWNEHPLHPKIADCKTVDWYNPKKKLKAIQRIKLFFI